MLDKASKILLAACLYYTLIGLTLIFWPGLVFEISGIHPVGAEIIAGAFGAALLGLGVAAAIGASMPASQWSIPVVLCFANAADLLVVFWGVRAGAIPILPGTFFLILDLGWIIALGMAIRWIIASSRSASEKSQGEIPSLEHALDAKPIGSRESLGELSDKQDIALVLVRHSGCTFCRTHLSEILEQQDLLLSKGAKIVVVSMSPEEDLRKLISEYPIKDVLLMSDPQRILFRALGTKQGGLWQLFGPRELWNALANGALFKHGIGRVSSDPTQLGGTFVISKRKIKFSRPAQSASEVCPLPTVAKAI